MPRTKLSKNTKRNREATNREEKIREYEAAVDQFLISLEAQAKSDIAELNVKMEMLKNRIPKQILQMTMADFRKLNIARTEFQPDSQTSNCLPQNQLRYGSSIRSVKISNDEGYLTEDSAKSGSRGSTLSAFTNTSQARFQIPNRGRTPGPYSSAKAKERQRRSKSACGDFTGGIVQPVSTLALKSAGESEHIPRSKMRTPNFSRSKAASADRYSKIRESQGSPTALLRWPKPGEKVISMQGSPLVAQVMPGTYANVNIPVKNGVLSLRPKRLASLNPEIIDNIDPQTFDQIKTLQSNLNLIMSYAEKTTNNN